MHEAALGGFGDMRRAAVGTVLLNAVQSKRTLCIHRLAKSRNQTLQFNNFPSNSAVSTGEMLVTAGQTTNQRAAGQPPTSAPPAAMFWRSWTPPTFGFPRRRPTSVASARAAMVSIAACFCTPSRGRRRQRRDHRTGRLHRAEPHQRAGQPAENRHQKESENPQTTAPRRQGIAPMAAGRRDGRRLSDERGHACPCGGGG